MSSALVVVDAQEGYLRDRPDVRRNIAAEVIAAAEHAWPIAVLEIVEWEMPERGHLPKYEFPGATVDEVEQALARCSQNPVGRHRKRGRDGSTAVLEWLDEQHLQPDLIRFCGGYVDGCLTCTAVHVLCARPHCRVELVRDACFTNWVTAWSNMLGLPRMPSPLVRLQANAATLPLFQKLREQLAIPWISVAALEDIHRQLAAHSDQPIQAVWK
jgi:nicotinamidase-related amidase